MVLGEHAAEAHVFFYLLLLRLAYELTQKALLLFLKLLELFDHLGLQLQRMLLLRSHQGILLLHNIVLSCHFERKELFLLLDLFLDLFDEADVPLVDGSGVCDQLEERVVAEVALRDLLFLLFFLLTFLILLLFLFVFWLLFLLIIIIILRCMRFDCFAHAHREAGPLCKASLFDDSVELSSLLPELLLYWLEDTPVVQDPHRLLGKVVDFRLEPVIQIIFWYFSLTGIVQNIVVE